MQINKCLLSKSKKKVVIIGGGVGAATFTKALKNLPITLTTIVSSFDDGGSTGMIRRDYGGWAVGDFRNCLLAASDMPEQVKQSLNHRFGPGQLFGMQAGNVFIKAILNTHLSFTKANGIIHQHFNIQHKVLPISLTDSKIKAVLSGGKTLTGQRAIAEYLSFSEAPIKSIGLTKKSVILPEAKKAILEADYIMLVPGHFFTILLPHLAVSGFARAFKKSKAKKIWFLNLLAHRGQDSYYTLVDYLRWFQKALGQKPFDLAVSSSSLNKKIRQAVIGRFLPIKVIGKDLKYLKKLKINYLQLDLAGLEIRRQHPNDTVARAPVRHDADKILKAASRIIN